MAGRLAGKACPGPASNVNGSPWRVADASNTVPRANVANQFGYAVRRAAGFLQEGAKQACSRQLSLWANRFATWAAACRTYIDELSISELNISELKEGPPRVASGQSLHLSWPADLQSPQGACRPVPPPGNMRWTGSLD